MATRDKLEEAEYFLIKMRETRPDQKEFSFNLSAFLSAARSVPDYLLEDYNVKYSLGIPLTEKLYPDTFENRAKRSGNAVALKFIQWWKQKIDILNSDPIWLLLKNKRNTGMHRAPIRPNLVITDEDTATTSESIRIEKYDKERRLTEIYESPEEPPKSKPKSEVSVDGFFKEYREPVILACEKYLQMMKDFVEEAEQKFS